MDTPRTFWETTYASFTPDRNADVECLAAVPLHGIGMFPEHIATVISIVAVLDPLGGTMGHTIMSTVFNNVVSLGPADDLLSDLDSFWNRPEEELADVVHRVKVRLSPHADPGIRFLFERDLNS